MNSRTRLLVLALAGLSEFHAAPGAAKAKPDAAASSGRVGDQSDVCLHDGLCRAHYTRARGLSKENDYEGALTAYEAAYRRRSVPWLLLNIGRTLHKLGKPAEALNYYRRYQQEDQAPAPERQKLLKEYTEQAEADVALQKPPSEPKPADKPPESPAPAAGAPGEPPAKPAVAGASDGKGPEAEAPAAAQQTRPPVAGPAPSTGGGAGLLGPLPASRPVMSRAGLWAGLGVTGGLLLVGASLGITAQVSSAQLHNTTYVGVAPTADVMALQDRTRGTAISADVFFGLSAVSLGVTLLATLVHKHAPRARSPEPVHTSGGVGSAVAPAPVAPADGASTRTKPGAAGKRAEDPAPAPPPRAASAEVAPARDAEVGPAPPATTQPPPNNPPPAAGSP